MKILSMFNCCISMLLYICYRLNAVVLRQQTVNKIIHGFESILDQLKQRGFREVLIVYSI